MDYLEHLIKGIESIEDWRSDFARHAQNVGLGKEGFDLSLITKAVFEENGKIIRVSSLPTTMERIAISQFFKKEGCDVFLSEKLIYKTPWCGVTEQEKLPQIKNSPEEKALEEICVCYPEQASKIKEMFRRYGFRWFSTNNYGVDGQGKVKVFDYIANMTWSSHRNFLVDGKGQEVFRFDS